MRLASLLITPLIILLALQLGGCTNSRSQSVTPPAPGGVYLSSSAGAFFDQSNGLEAPQASGKDTANIAQFPLQSAFRPDFAPDTIYVAAGKQGYIVSNNNGESWHQMTVPLAAAYDIVVLQQNVIILTGVDAQGQGYIIRSADEGLSWQVVLTVPIPIDKKGLQLVKPPGGGKASATVIISIAPDPFEPDQIYAGTSLGNIFKGEQYGKTWHLTHTLGRGALSIGSNNSYTIKKVIPSPFVSGQLLVLTGDQKIFQLNGDDKISELKIKLQDNSDSPFAGSVTKKVLDAAYIAGFPDALLVGVEDSAVISRDRGETWQQLPLPVDTIKSFNTVIVTTSPRNPSRLLVAINDVVYRSEDGGRTWNVFTLGLPGYTIYSLLINPANPSHVLALTTPVSS